MILKTHIFILLILVQFFAFKNALSNNIYEEITKWANFFVGIKYDANPVGTYVTTLQVEDDTNFDCMSFTFRVLELSHAKTKEEAQQNALFFRFPTGVNVSLNEGRVSSYQGRFEYGEDMVLSGKFGKDVSAFIAPTEFAKKDDKIAYIKTNYLIQSIEKLNNGDIIFFVKDANKRMYGEVVAHIGFIEKTKDGIFLIHASGSKAYAGKSVKEGYVVKVPLLSYLQNTNFIGAIITRL